jgi:hypothetical protein
MLAISSRFGRRAGGLVSRARLQQPSRVGAVRTLLNGSAPIGDDFVFNVTHADFATRVTQSPIPVVVDCYAHW